MRIFTALFVCAIVLFSLGVQAQTRDGETPAVEAVCDSLANATPGLYGLCVAYCEAQDLEFSDELTPDEIVDSMPKEKILANYNRKKKDSDPAMPCLLTAECPCFNQAEADSVAAVATRCEQDYTWSRGFITQDRDLLAFGKGNPMVFAIYSVNTRRTPTQSLSCTYRDGTFSSPWSVTIGIDESFTEEDQASFDACVNTIDAAISTSGLTCRTN